MKIDLFAKKTLWLPTWKGWLLILTIFVTVFTVVVLRVNHWLSVDAPYDKGYLIIDGSIPDYAIEAAILHYDSSKYDKLVVTGGPVPVGSYHNKYKTYAEVGHAKLIAFEFNAEEIIVLNTSYALKDRTYHNALVVKNHLGKEATLPAITVFEIGAHARRSRLLYEMAFANEVPIGIIALEDINFDPDRWWNSSIGFRTVIGELLAYLYVRIFFKP